MNPISAFAIELPAPLRAALLRREQAAFAEVYRQFERPAYTLAVRVLGNTEDAMEVLHDAFLQAFQRIGSWRGEAPFWAWFRQITLNQALMRLRQRRPESNLEEPAVDAEHGLAPSPLVAVQAQELERALAQLPVITRSVIWLYHAEGLTHEEIAQGMGRSISFSKSQLARGTRRLRELLDLRQEAPSHV